VVYRCILPQWALDANPSQRRVLEGEFSAEKIAQLNEKFYNIYYLPNSPSIYDGKKTVDGCDIDNFQYVFVDMDLKEGKFATKEDFISTIDIEPTSIVDSGNGIHVYWEVTDLDAMSYLKLSRRLMRKFNTDEAVGQIYQLMRVPGTVNTKHEDDFKMCEELYRTDKKYTSEDLDALLPPLTKDDEEYCKQHFDKTYNLNQKNTEVDEKLPLKFEKLMRENSEVREIWTGQTDDRSKADYRLGHIMFAAAFTREEALSVLVNTAKALTRAPKHRVGYAENIVDKIWTFEMAQDKETLGLSMSVREILEKNGDSLKGTRFPCWRYLDDTLSGFRLGQVIGLVAGSGVGKTAIALNMFMGFVRNNPDYEHFFIPLEQPANEIAERWQSMCGADTYLYDKVHVMSNYDPETSAFRHLSLDDIKAYLLKFQKVTGKKIGCVVIDHIGALKKKGKNGENQDLMDICHSMKAFAVETNTMLVMQSQAPREKAGIGDLELNKDAAYGTVYFESYCDYLISIWQPLKRCYMEEGCPTVTAFKFCKIRHKKQGFDTIQEDVCYTLIFDPQSERLREMTQDEEKSFDFFLKKATNKRKLDRKTDIISYQSRRTEPGEVNGKANRNPNP
jgi:KaiC/GvpD/RAD55 family RecA-like ATPase